MRSNYQLSKLYKSPDKASFIITSLTCSVKPLSKYLTSVSKLIFNHVKFYTKQSLSIRSYPSVLDGLDKLNRKGKAKSEKGQE